VNVGILIVTILIFLHFQICYSQEANIWVPKQIITGENYEGLVVLDKAFRFGQVIALSSSDPSIIQVPESITILPYSNHGIFSIKPQRHGDVEVFAVVNGEITSAKLFVYSSSRQPEGLKIILPVNTTKTQTMVGYVLSTDAKGFPGPVAKDTLINVFATPMIEIESSKLEIKEGKHHAKFIAKIKGSGRIYANSEGLTMAEHEITKIQDKVSVRVAVAPDIIMENSKAYFFVWLEKDGKPYKLPYVIHAYLSSSNVKSIRFSESPQIKQYSDSVLKISLVDGVGSSYLISQDDGTSIITANVEGFGSAQTNVVVGPVLLDDNFEFVEPDDDNKLGQIASKKANIAFAWFYPDITDSKSYGIVALYNTNFTQKTTTIVTANETQVVVSNTINRVVPVPLDGRTITLSSAGLNHPNILTLTESNEILLKRGIGSTHAAQFEVLGASQGNYTISVSGPGLEMFQSDLAIVPPFRDSYKLKITPILSIFGTKNDLAMISVVDNSDALIDVQKMFAGPLKVNVFSNNEHSNISISSLNSAIYSGILNENTQIIASASGLTPNGQKISPSGIASSLVLDVPQKIHVSESFPYAIHEVDLYGVPIRKLNFTSISSTSGIRSDGKYFRIDNIGLESLAAVTKIGADSKQIESFANTFSFAVIPNGTTNRIGKEFELRLESDVDGFEVVVDSPIPYEKINEYTYLVFPNIEGYHNITFTALKDVYAPSRGFFSILAEKFVSLVLKAAASDGTDLNIGQTIRVGNLSKSIVTPYEQEIRPQFIETVFPADFVVGNKGYRLDHVRFEDQKITDGKINNIFLNKNTEIVASYQRMVKIEIENAQGSGFYPYGQTVVLSVPPKDKAFFLIRDVFDHWEGLDYSYDHVVFAATHDIKARAVLREDYTFLMLIISSGMTLFLYNNFVRRKGLNLMFYFEKINPTILGKILKSLFRTKPAPEKRSDRLE
jgi:hypothetical protein